MLIQKDSLAPLVLNSQVLEEAAQWYAKLQAVPVSHDIQQAWQQWYSSDVLHQLAWQRVKEISQRFTDIADTPTAKALYSVNRKKRRSLQVLSLAIIGAGTFGVMTQVRPVREYMQSMASSFHTKTNKMTQLALANGGNIWLNTRSAINVDNSQFIQQIELLYGEVYVSADKKTVNTTMPLQLTTPQGRVEVVQSDLAVRSDSTSSQVAVFTGQAALFTENNLRKSILSGQQVSFSTDAIGEIEPADAYRQSWVKGLLIADDMRLSTMTDELSRYYSGYIHCDPAVANLRVVGTFSLNNIDAIFTSLENSLPVRVRYITQWWVSIVPVAV